MRSVAIIGSGIAGLAAALRVRDVCGKGGEPVRVTMYDREERAGGCVQTLYEQDLIMEAGADSMLVDKPWGVNLLRRLGIEDQLVPIRPEYRGARIVSHGKLRPLPSGFRLFSPTSLPALFSSGLSPLGVARAALEPLIPPRKSNDDESLSSFVTRRFGREVLDRFAQPLIGGIYSADPARLSMKAVLPQFLELERKHGSLIRAMAANKGARPAPTLMSLRGGLGTMVTSLERELADIERVHERITDLRALRSRHDAIVCAIPAYAAADLLRADEPQLAALLDQIRYNSIATVNLAYGQEIAGQLPRTQGFVVPFVEGRRIVAGTISTQKYAGRAPNGIVLLRAFIGGALQSELLRKDDAQLKQIAGEELSGLLGFDAVPALCVVQRFERLLPEYGIGHVGLVEEIEARAATLPRFALAGSAYHGVGIPDCIHSGEVAAEKILDEPAIKR